MSTIRDVARLAEVSIATVSRVLNSDVQFQTSSETRQKVLEAAYQLKYTANKKGKLLRDSHKVSTLSVGCILNPYPIKYVDSYYMCLLSNFETELARLGGTVVFTKTVKELEMHRLELKSMLKNVGSVILMEYLDDNVLNYFQDAIPYILGVDIEDPRLDVITYDRMEANYMATQYLIQNGHTRIGYLSGREVAATGNFEIFGNKRFWGYRNALLSYKIQYDPSIVRDCEWNVELCRNLVQEMMRCENPPTAILAASDTIAIAAISACGEMGLHIPEDVSVMGISDNKESKYSNPPLTTVRIPQDLMGTLAARMIQCPETEHKRKVHVPLSLIERNSVRKIDDSINDTA